MKVETSWRRTVFVWLLMAVATEMTLAQQVTGDGRISPVTLYYNKSWELTTPEKATFTRETSLDLENIVFTGVSKDFSAGHKILTDGYYDHGVNKGLHSEYFDDGVLESTFEYTDDGFIIWELTTEDNVHQVVHGNGKFSIEYYYAISEGQGIKLKEGVVTGEFVQGKRVGTWTYMDKGGAKTDEEVYVLGTFVKRTSFSAKGNTVYEDKKPIIISLSALLAEAFSFDPAVFSNLNQYFEKYLPPYATNFHRPVTFPGGLKKLLLLIATELQVDLSENILVTMTVDGNGKLLKLKPAGVLFAWQISGELARVVAPHQLKLLPAVQDGKPYTCAMRIPIGNSPEWIHYLETAADDDVNAYIDEINKN